MKRNLLFLVVIILMLSACATSIPDAEPASEAASEQAVEPATESVSESAVENRPQTLMMWTWKAFHIPGLEAVANRYFEETGQRVEFEFFGPDDAYRTRIQTAAQSGELPDILAYWSGGQWDLASSGILINITDQVDDEWTGSFLPGTFEKSSIWTQTRYDTCQANIDCTDTDLDVGDIFSVPFTVGSFGIVYINRTMLEEAGLDPAIVPQDSEAFLDMMQQVKEATGKGATIGGKFQDILRNWIVDDLAMTNCGVQEYVAMLNGEEGATFTTECTQQAYGFIGQMTERDLWQPGFQTLTIDEADISFARGEAAFLFGGSFTLGFLIQQGMAPEDIHVITLPALPTSRQNPIALSPFSLIDLAVTTHSETPDAALDFVHYLTSAEAAAEFARITGDLPGVAISSDPAVVGEVMASLAGTYDNASEAYRATDVWSGGIQAGTEVRASLNLVANHQVTGESDLLTDLEAADAAAAFDRTNRAE